VAVFNVADGPQHEIASRYAGSRGKSCGCGENGCRDGIAPACSSGAASTHSSSAILSRRLGSFIVMMQPRAKLTREEPDAGMLHVRVCEGWGWQHPHLLGIAPTDQPGTRS
jgi:hypothetical protein